MPLKAPETREEWAAATEPSRRRARFAHVRARIEKIIDGTPLFTADELDELGAMFTAAARVRRETAA
jgi:hypothetical protein